jgi:amidase
MNLEEYSALDAVALADLVRKKQVTPRELAEIALLAVDSVNGSLNAVLETFPDRVDEIPVSNSASPSLFGVPMLNKDVYGEAGRLLEMGSLLAKGMIASEDSHLMSRLRSAGLINLGRTTTPEFAMATVTESRIAGKTHNPWSLQRTPGGSSGGSAAMVAAGVVPIATASDGGGSIRSPAAHCGIVGLKPTRGRVSSGPDLSEPFGAMSVDFVVTRSVRDCAVVLDAVHGVIPRGAHGIPTQMRPFREELHAPDRPLRIAYATTAWSGESADREGQRALTKTLKVLESGGHIVEEALPPVDATALSKATLDLVCANLVHQISAIERAVSRQADSTTLQSAILSFYRHGQRLTPAELTSALATFKLLSHHVGHFFQRYDIFVTPTCMSVAPLIGELQCDSTDEVDAALWNDRMNAIDAFLGVFNVSGNPAISLPLYASADGLPVGVQFVAPFGSEATLLQLGIFVEQEVPWQERRPPVHVSHAVERQRAR